MERHMNTEELSSLVEGLHSDLDMARIRKHLNECQRCRQVFQDAVRDRGLWKIDDNEFPSSPELIAAGDSVVSVGNAGAVRSQVWAGSTLR